MFDFEGSFPACLQPNSTQLNSAPSTLSQTSAVPVAETLLNSGSSDELQAELQILRAGCSCVAMFGVCVCGFQWRWEAHVKRAHRCPHMQGEGLLEDEMCKTLVSLEIPRSIARQAAELHPSNLDAALDWACLLFRTLMKFLEIEDSPVAAVPLLASNGPASMASSGVPPVPASRTSRALDSHSVDVPNLLGDSQLVPACATQQSIVPTPSLLHEDTTASLDIHGFGAGLRQMPTACYLDDPQGEVDYYFAMLANTRGDCALHQDFWESIPEYSQYISGHTFEQILEHSLDNLERIRSQRIVEQAAQLPAVLPRTTSLRLAVACEYLHRGCGFPRIFAFDLFQACLASCQNKDLSVKLYARESENFTSKARWWACPVGDPNAGKSPTRSFLSNAFQKLAASA